MLEEILGLIKEHEDWRGKNRLNLIPSENIMSPLVSSILSSDLGNRYTSIDKFYKGTKFIDEIEKYGEKIAKEVFEVEVADLRPLSGHIANWIFLSIFTKPNDKIMCLSIENGGYPGIWESGLSTLLKLKPIGFPFSKERMNIIIDNTIEIILKEKPKVIIFGASFFLFPHPVKEIAKIAKEIDSIIAYDGSHVLGLIAGKEFQAPIKEGAYVLYGSTHKTFFGPQGGIILANKEYGKIIKERISPTFIDNAHWNRIAALTLALIEMKEFGKEYTKQVIKNAYTLAKVLSEYGIPIKCAKYGFTKSHQVILDYDNYDKKVEIAKKLEEANIIVDHGIRLGTSEITRRGMKENEMEKIAEFIKRILIDKEEIKKVKEEVIKFVQEFQNIEYCLKI